MAATDAASYSFLVQRGYYREKIPNKSAFAPPLWHFKMKTIFHETINLLKISKKPLNYVQMIQKSRIINDLLQNIQKPPDYLQKTTHNTPDPMLMVRLIRTI